MGRETEVLKELQREYAAALKQIEEKIKLLQADELTQSRIYQLQYQHALKAQVEAILEKLHADEYSTIQQYLSDSYSDGFISTMYCFHKQDVPLILPIDKKAAVRAILTDSKIRGSLYESLGINVNAMKKSIRQEINRGIASGLSYADIIRNLKNATKAPLANAKTIVRTEGHRIQQASAEDARMQAKAKGADVVKQWDATMDGDTRPMHQQLDGQIKETNEPFAYGSKKAMYPGDFGDPAEDCNCRCVALTRARWALDEEELKTMQERAAFFGLDKSDSFEEFKEKYLKAAETVEKSGNLRYNNDVEMLQKYSEARKQFKFISEERFDQLTISVRKQGANIIRGTDDVEAHLDAMEASASVIGDTILFRKNVAMCEVLEETHHFMQNLRHLNDEKGEPLRTILNEIDAKEFVINNAERYKVPRNEIEHIKRQLESYKQQLAEYKKGGE